MRSSPVLSCFPPSDFEFGEVNGLHLALRRTVGAMPCDWLADHSHVRKILWVGEDAPAQLATAGLSDLPLLRRVPHPAGGWVVRIGNMRYLLAGAAAGMADANLPPGLLALPMDSVDLALGGPAAPTILAEFCAIPLAACTDTGWYPVSLGGHEVALWRERKVFHVVCAPADGISVFKALAAGLHDARGELIGLHDTPAHSSTGVQA